jgi:uncharacterized RDD family membrane protein YckC
MMREKTHTLTIVTPEGIPFAFQLAGPIARFLAWCIDLATIFALISLLNAVLKVIGVLNRDLATAGSIVGYFVISVGYGMALEWFWRGQTLGKRLLRLRVLDAHGLRLQHSQVVVRNLMRFVDSLPALYLVGGIATLITRKAQRLGDFVAGTIVVVSRPAVEPDFDQLLVGKYNSFRDYPHLEARLRQQVTPGEARVALQALTRREDLDSAARVELFAELASYFRGVVPFPPEATESISDEQYIRNVIEALFRPDPSRI